MGRSKVAWFLIACLISCCPPAVPTHRLSDLIDYARQRWVTATCRDPVFRKVTLVKGTLKCGFIESAYGCYFWETEEILISSRVPADKLLQTLTHEHGHALSFDRGHVSAGMGIMSPSISAATSHITQADLDLVCSHQECLCQRPESVSNPLTFTPP